MCQVWYCTSSRAHTTVAKYAEYIATSFKEAKERLSDKFSINPTVSCPPAPAGCCVTPPCCRLRCRVTPRLASRHAAPSSSEPTVICRTRRSGGPRYRNSSSSPAGCGW